MTYEDDLREFIAGVSKGERITSDSPCSYVLHEAAQNAMRTTAELNCGYHSPEEIVSLMSQLIGRAVDPSLRLFPPFNADFGRNISLGKNVFINSGCCFQDQGEITIGDGVFIGHHVVLATLNHDLDPEHRDELIPGRIVIEDNVWIGSNSTILAGVTIGKDSVVAAGAVVNKDVPEGVVAGGVPARIIKSLR